ncbi:MAG: methyltransferase domain-containing protein [Rhodospirillaceae bacterium]|jgi:SAM-dependent methyltransferase|nr:methyltransferase domain-containing protein [Rhodospirillaceae bacterium]MBT5239872.1 methyltransferase domain-containing protein [Rhodospirillaceae bacterium]MBT5567111.1 methyltransferase domain-containing protein [Rhodospirillaceae bacterium]MBT6089325.1 methyltransferase domain-containing protein [Rhodospirillaceae bacterium]MBT6960970.1 methyltransferase domain-containing protein [Rhodospirillaceae bacterium]
MPTSKDSDIASQPYASSFYKEQTPAYLHYAMQCGTGGQANVGLPAAFSPSETFASCDIGCGFGLTPLITAVADPTADVWGFDFNAEHISSASALADAAGTSNITLLDASFETFLDRSTPDFDLITLHGIYSWVSPENRHQILDILSNKLKPGGVVYVSYNCFTGWASSAPVQQFLTDYIDRTNSESLAGVGKATALVDQMRSAGAAFFGVNPQAGKILDIALQSDPRYLVHEYLTGNWTLFSLAQVANELVAAGLSYVGSADLTHAFDVFHMTPEAQAMLGDIDDLLLQQSARDFFMTSLLRKDIFVKDPQLITSDQQTEALMDQRFCATKPADQLPQHFNFPRGGVSLTADAHAAIKEALIQGPASARMVIDASGAELKSVLNGLKLLTDIGFLAPALPETMTTVAQEHTDRFNAALAGYEKGGDEPVPFYASPITGGGVSRESDPDLLRTLGVTV